MKPSPLLVPLLALAVLAGVMWSFRGFVEDDAYVSLRYAANLIAGNGLVYNAGERVEGITNIGWTLLAAALLELGLPAFPILQVLGGMAALALVLLAWWEAGGRDARADPRAGWCAGVAAAVLASSTILGARSVTGLETAPFALLVLAGAAALARGRFGFAMGVLAAATWVRPEGALAGALAIAVQAVHCAKRERPGRAEALGLAVYALSVGALIVFRRMYYGEWVPNSYFVKGMGTVWSHHAGFLALDGLLAFQGLRWILLLALAGLALRARELATTRGGIREIASAGHVTRGCAPAPNLVRGEAADDRSPCSLGGIRELAFSSLWLIAYLYYYVRIGGDDPWYRLAMPVLPFAAVWAARGLCGLWDRSRIVSVAALALLGAVCLDALNLSARAEVLRDVHRRMWACHAEAGRWLEAAAARRHRPITAVVDQSGLIAYVAPHVRFLDVVGLSDRTIARALYTHGFLRDTAWQIRTRGGDMEPVKEAVRTIRAYLEERRPEYVLLPVRWGMRHPGPYEQALARRDGAFFSEAIGRNSVFHRFGADERFHRDHELVRGFEFADGAHLLLFARRDLTATLER